MELVSLKFLNPQFLWLLWVLPLLAVSMVWFAWARQKRAAENFGEWHLYAKFSQLVTKVRYAFRAVALAGAVAALIVAMAQCRWMRLSSIRSALSMLWQW